MRRSLQELPTLVVVVIEVGEALQAVPVLQVVVVVVLVDGEAEPSAPVEEVEIRTVVVVQSEKVVLDEQDDVEEVEDELFVEESELEVLWFSFSLTFCSMLLTMLLISSRNSDPFLMVFSISLVISSGFSGISWIISFAIGSMQLIAASAMSLAVFKVAPAASEARFPMALKTDLFRLEPEHGDLLVS